MLDHMKALAKENNICTYMNKDEIIGLLLDKQIITTFNPTVMGEKQEAQLMLTNLRDG